jgi:hypothetical protein
MSTPVTRPAFSGFPTKTARPTRRGLLEMLGRARAAWEDIEGHLAETYGLTGQLHHMYGARYGWALRFLRGGRLITAMYPNRGRVTVQIILGRAQVAAAGAMDLTPSVVRVFAAAKDYPEGRWLFIPVKSLKGARELRPLLALKLARAPRAAHS